MLARLLAIPLVILVFIFLYLAWTQGGQWAIYMAPPLILLAVIYVFSPQLNWWYFLRRPPKLDRRLQQLLLKRSPYYQNLSVADKKKFRTRMSLYMEAHDFQAMGDMDTIPADALGVLAHAVVELTFGQEDFLLDKFEKIILYFHPFPSPQYPKHLHTSELYEEDGVLLFSVPHLIRGFMEPTRYFSLAHYEYAKALHILYPDWKWPILGESSWEKLERISGFSKDAIQRFINLPDIDPLAVAVHHLFQFTPAFRLHWPEMYERLAALLGQEAYLKEVG